MADENPLFERSILAAEAFHDRRQRILEKSTHLSAHTRADCTRQLWSGQQLDTTFHTSKVRDGKHHTAAKLIRLEYRNALQHVYYYVWYSRNETAFDLANVWFDILWGGVKPWRFPPLFHHRGKPLQWADRLTLEDGDTIVYAIESKYIHSFVTEEDEKEENKDKLLRTDGRRPSSKGVLDSSHLIWSADTELFSRHNSYCQSGRYEDSRRFNGEIEMYQVLYYAERRLGWVTDQDHREFMEDWVLKAQDAILENALAIAKELHQEALQKGVQGFSGPALTWYIDHLIDAWKRNGYTLAQRLFGRLGDVVNFYPIFNVPDTVTDSDRYWLHVNFLYCYTVYLHTVGDAIYRLRTGDHWNHWDTQEYARQSFRDMHWNVRFPQVDARKVPVHNLDTRVEEAEEAEE